jgi:HD-GYP domain-containing protein (c-di-GMP phosphodiesterase class II)
MLGKIADVAESYDACMRITTGRLPELRPYKNAKTIDHAVTEATPDSRTVLAVAVATFFNPRFIHHSGRCQTAQNAPITKAEVKVE